MVSPGSKRSVKSAMALASGAVSGAVPTKSAGAGEVIPRAYLFSLACSQPAGYWRFRSTPRMLAFQPEGKG